MEVIAAVEMTRMEIENTLGLHVDRVALLTNLSEDEVVARLRVALAARAARIASEKSWGRDDRRFPERRFAHRALGVCVNGWKHGDAVKGGRCQRCWDAKQDAQRKDDHVAR